MESKSGHLAEKSMIRYALYNSYLEIGRYIEGAVHPAVRIEHLLVHAVVSLVIIIAGLV